MGGLIDHAGERFGRLVVLAREPNTPLGHAVWECRCDCGSRTVVLAGDLRSGATKSCGCLRSEIVRAKNTTHGLRNHPMYGTWAHMRGRCQDKNDKSYPRYGGRGITICKEWEDFSVFLRDMGPAPQGMSIDRIDNNKGYRPDNCRWATPTEQNRNTSAIKLSPEQATAIRRSHKRVRALAEEHGVSVATIRDVKKGRTWT